MSVQVLAEVFESDITDGRLLLLALANNANKKGICWPGSVSLASDAGMSRSTVFRSLKVLEKQNLVQRRTRKRRNGSLTSNVYVLNREAIRARKRDNADEERREQEEFLRALMDETDPVEQDADDEPGPSDEPTNSSDRGTSVNSRLVPDRHGGSTDGDTRACPPVTPPEPSVEPSVDPEGETPEEPPDRTRPVRDAPPPPAAFVLDDRSTWMCKAHRAAGLRPDDPKPSCGACGDTRRWAERQLADRARAVAEQEAAEHAIDASRAADCTWHDEAGWVVDPATAAPFEHPAVRCDHVATSPQSVQAAVAARQQPQDPTSTEEGRARAKAMARQRLSEPETPTPRSGVAAPSGAARSHAVHATRRLRGGMKPDRPAPEPARTA